MRRTLSSRATTTLSRTPLRPSWRAKANPLRRANSSRNTWPRCRPSKGPPTKTRTGSDAGEVVMRLRSVDTPAGDPGLSTGPAHALQAPDAPRQIRAVHGLVRVHVRVARIRTRYGS